MSTSTNDVTLAQFLVLGGMLFGALFYLFS